IQLMTSSLALIAALLVLFVDVRGEYPAAQPSVAAEPPADHRAPMAAAQPVGDSLWHDAGKAPELPAARASRGCKTLNWLHDGQPHPKTDTRCTQSIKSGCACRYLPGDKDSKGCPLNFHILCKKL
ncbi:hypothetical protein PMAYCL1PPCAC_26838, partial [Pristionchus mayeri]